MRRVLALLSAPAPLALLVLCALLAAAGPAFAKEQSPPPDPAAQAAEEEAQAEADATAEATIEEMVHEEPAVELESDILARLPEIAEAVAAVEANPDDSEAWRVLGVRLVDRAGFKDGVKALKQATKLDKTNVAAWVDLGAAYVRSGNVSSGMSAIRHALKLEPFSAVAHYNMGIAYQADGDYEAAYSSFETALLLDSRLADVKYNPGALNNPALPYVQLGVYMKREGAAPALFWDQSPKQVPAAPAAGGK
jgi:Flp pilus assembly protein TadD